MRTHLHAYARRIYVKLSVQVSDFEDICLLIQLARLICDFCSSGQRFACGFLQIPPRDGHPCRPANSSPCRVCRRLSLPSKCALPGAQIKRRRKVNLRRLRLYKLSNSDYESVVFIVISPSMKSTSKLSASFHLVVTGSFTNSSIVRLRKRAPYAGLNPFSTR